MRNLVIAENPKNWSLELRDATMISARQYLTDPTYFDAQGLRVFNLCRSYRYQSVGYYVSLLAMARGHRALPSIETIQDLKSPTLTRIVAGDLEDLFQKSLRHVEADHYTLSVYFGRNLAKRYNELSGRLFRLFQAPMLRAEFVRAEGEWSLRSIGPMARKDINETHKDFLAEAASQYFSEKPRAAPARRSAQYELAILHRPDEPNSPSNAGALKRFQTVARQLSMNPQLIEAEDFSRLAEFDALLIRATTAVNHYTYRFARRAAAEGLAVIDDPASIVHCTNKVYMAELLERHEVPAPKTLIVHRDNRDEVAGEIGLPCILKTPDGSFSLGVKKAEDAVELERLLDEMFEKSDLLIAQEFMPTEFDWRVGVLEGRPLFVCKYYMAAKHWQIARNDGDDVDYGRVEPVIVDAAPKKIVRTAVKAARLIGDGLYGVDLKEVYGQPKVVEVNDNPNIDKGFEDAILGDVLYERILRWLMERVDRRRQRGGRI